jgi:hypothetical protein
MKFIQCSISWGMKTLNIQYSMIAKQNNRKDECLSFALKLMRALSIMQNFLLTLISKIHGLVGHSMLTILKL